MLWALLLPGCSSGKKVSSPWTQAQADTLLVQALDASHPDDRRKAIDAVADSRFVSSDSNIRTTALVVKSDVNFSVRQAAARSLGACGRSEGIEALLEALDTPASPVLARPADASFRRSCLCGLERLASGGVTPEDTTRLVSQVSTLLAKDANRDVRISAARLLGYFKTSDSLTALVDALQQTDFAVTYEAEQSLVKLTGRTHRRDAKAWRAWLAESTDPFAGAGQKPAELAGAEARRPWWNPFARSGRNGSGS